MSNINCEAESDSSCRFDCEYRCAGVSEPCVYHISHTTVTNQVFTQLGKEPASLCLFLLLGFCGLHVSSIKMKCMSRGLEVGGLLSFTECEYSIWIKVLMVEAKLPESVPGPIIYQDTSSCRPRFIHKVEILVESIS